MTRPASGGPIPLAKYAGEETVDVGEGRLTRKCGRFPMIPGQTHRESYLKYHFKRPADLPLR